MLVFLSTFELNFRAVTTLDQYNMLFFISALLLMLCKLLQPKRFSDFLKITGYGTYNQIYKRPSVFSIQKFDLLLFFQFLLASSLFLNLIGFNNNGTQNLSLNAIFRNIFILFVYVFLKRLLELFAGRWLKIESQISAYLFQKMNSLHFFGLWLFLANMLMVYSIGRAQWLIYVTLSIGAAILTIGFITTFFRFRFLIRHRWLLFILYLCAFEIAPLAVLWKFVI
jgi:hypothetical protein